MPVRPFTGTEIRALRKRENVSQPILARYLRVTPGLVSAWERGEKKPGGSAALLLALVEKKGLGHIAV